MIKRKPAWSSVLLSLLLSGWLLSSLAGTVGAQSGPDFTLKDVANGQTYTLRQFRGQVVVVNFFTYLCKPCKEEMPILNQLDREYKGRGFQVIGIGLGSKPEELLSVAQQLGLSYPVLMGNDEVSQAFGKVDFVPATFFIDRQGNLVQKSFEALSKADLIKLIKPLL